MYSNLLIGISYRKRLMLDSSQQLQVLAMDLIATVSDGILGCEKFQIPSSCLLKTIFDGRNFQNRGSLVFCFGLCDLRHSLHSGILNAYGRSAFEELHGVEQQEVGGFWNSPNIINSPESCKQTVPYCCLSLDCYFPTVVFQTCLCSYFVLYAGHNLVNSEY